MNEYFFDILFAEKQDDFKLKQNSIEMNQEIATEIVELFFQRFVQQDAKTVFIQWLKFSRNKNITKDLNDILQLICFEPIKLSITKTHVKLFDKNEWAKIELNCLLPTTREPLLKMTSSEMMDWFFVSQLSNNLKFDQENFTNFKFNEIAEKILERRKLIYFFVWILLHMENENEVTNEQRFFLVSFISDQFYTFATDSLNKFLKEHFDNPNKFSNADISKYTITCATLLYLTRRLKNLINAQFLKKQTVLKISWKHLRKLFINVEEQQ